MRRFDPFLFLASLALVSCSGTNEPNLEAAYHQANMRLLDLEIRHLIGDAAAQDSTDCHTIGYGDKPCGGPWGYLVYSSRGIDEAQLERLVGEYNEANENYNRAAGIGSDCDAGPPPPRVGCIDGRCVELPRE